MLFRPLAIALLAAALAGCAVQPAATDTPTPTRPRQPMFTARPATVIRDTPIHTRAATTSRTARTLAAGTKIDIYERHDQWVSVAADPGTQGIEWIRMLDVRMPVDELAAVPDYSGLGYEIITLDEQIERSSTAITFTGVLKNNGGHPAYQLRVYLNAMDLAELRAIREQNPAASVVVPRHGYDVALPDLAPGASVPYQIVKPNPLPDWDYSIGYTSLSAPPASPPTPTP
ncbi:MAG TPA: hypothetical protein VGE07_30365 [Herpetosiphonaceae bacterium]